MPFSFCLNRTIVADKMRIQLHRLWPPESVGLVGDFITNDDGRLTDGPALKGGNEFIVGTYEWTFYVADYFASKGTFTSGTPFLDTIPLRFGIDNPDDHYHGTYTYSTLFSRTFQPQSSGLRRDSQPNLTPMQFLSWSVLGASLHIEEVKSYKMHRQR